jgi:hypothetical protein
MMVDTSRAMTVLDPDVEAVAADQRVGAGTRQVSTKQVPRTAEKCLAADRRRPVHM